MQHLSLEWKTIDKQNVALVFDTATWSLLQAKADAKGADTQDMIVEATAALLGPVVTRHTQN